jgi:hypothetical protein
MALRDRRGEEARPSFFEKKKQKTSTYCVRFRGVRGSTGKSFLLLFFKKEGLPSWPPPPLSISP